MQDARLPKLLFVLLAAFAAVYFSFCYSLLPATVASHFDGRGTPNGWQTRAVFFGFFIGASVLAGAVAFGIPRIIADVPIQAINLPNKEYWLAESRRTASLEFLNAYFAWLGCAVYLIVIFAFNYAVQSNLHPSDRPDVSRLWYAIASFTAFSVAWMIRMFTRFGPPPQTSPGRR